MHENDYDNSSSSSDDFDDNNNNDNNMQLSTTSAPQTSWDRRLYRQLILKTTSTVGLAIQLCGVIIFTFVAFYEGEYVAFSSESKQFDWQPRTTEVRATVKWFVLPVWFMLGLIYEYSLVILGRHLYLKWVGWRGIVTPILYFLIGFILSYQFHLHHYNHFSPEGYYAMASFLLCALAAYLFMLRTNMTTRRQLANIYQQQNSSIDRHLSLSPIVLQKITQDTIKSLGFEKRDIGIHECLSKYEIRTVQDIINIIEGLSRSVSPLKVCLPQCIMSRSPANGALSPKEYRILARQYFANVMEGGCDEEDGTIQRSKQRTVPLSTFDVAMAIVNKWSKAPKEFATTFVVITMSASIIPLQSTFLGLIVDGINSGDSDRVIMRVIVWGSLLGVSSIIDIIFASMAAKLNGRAMKVCRSEVLSIILAGDVEFADLFSTSDTIDTFTTQMARVEFTLINATYTLLLSLLQLIIGCCFAFRLSWLIGLTFISMLPIVFSIDKVITLSLKSSEASASQERELNAKLISMMNCLPVIRSCDASNWVERQYISLIKDFSRGKVHSIRMSNYVQSYYQVFGNLYTAFCVIPWGVQASRGYVSAGDFTTLVTLTAGMVLPLFELGGFMRNTTMNSGSMMAVDNILKRGPQLSESSSNRDNAELKPLCNELVVKDMKFTYPDTASLVLNGINLTIRKGTYVCLCGSSGSGKSTLLDILMQNRKPQAGRITWDGKDIYHSTKKSFRSNVGVMFQRTMVLQASIYDNITFGMDDATLDDVKRAAEKAQIADVINATKDGYETVLGSGTVDLSGGQLQRICLARLLLRKCSVILLDEATSALDPVSEAAIIKTILQLRDIEGLTIVSVTHHPVTTVNADEIVVLDGGTVAQQGTYEELANDEQGLFFRMVRAGENEGGM